MARRPHVVIVGGGFGGLDAARALAHEPVDITLVDRRNHHVFQPLLYQVATAALNPADIAQPIRSVLRKQSNVTVLLDEAVAVEAAQSRLQLRESGALAYDYLVLATGARHSYFGHDDWEERAPGLKTIEDALEIRRRILYAFEEAERAQDRDQQPWLTFVVVGGGPTGVELAGAITEVAFHALKRDFRRIDPRRAHVVLLEASPHVLAAYSPESQRRARQQLEQLGVTVRTKTPVTAIDGSGVTVAGGERIAARTVLWGAGVLASPLGRTLGVPLDRAGRVLVTPTLNPPGIDNVFVVGDLAAVKQEDGAPVPGVAPAAMQMGKYAAQAIVDLTHDKPIFAHPFRYVNKGELATIGRKKAIADMPGHLRLWGFVAWLAWLFIHIFFLIGFRNRFIVVFEWAWAYVTFQRGARLITGPLPPGPAAAADAPARPASRPVEKSPTPPPAA
jgi:NADH dehydrogenase